MTRTSTIARRLAGIGLIATSLSGCKETAAPASMPRPIAPIKRAAVKQGTLPTVKFKDITESAGIKFNHVNGARGDKLLPETMGSGVAFLDYDGDGDPDLFFVNSDVWPGQGGGARPTQALYRNDGGGKFTDVTAQAGLDKTCFGMGVAVGDYDGDGDPDIYITALGGGHLFRNDKGKFVDVTAEAGAKGSDGWQSSAAFFDMENDGDLDLFICHYVAWSPEIDQSQTTQLTGTGKGAAYDPPTGYNGSLCILLRNDGGKFTDVGESSGIHVRSTDLRAPRAKSLGVAPYDVDGDGLVDIAVANDTVANFFFHNQGNGKFEERAMTSGVAYDSAGSPRGGMGICWGYFKNDATLGLAVANFANEMIALYVVTDPRSLQFSDLASAYGLGADTQPPLKFGLFFFDYDLDGRVDLLSVNGHLESDIAKVQASESYAQSALLFWNTGQAANLKFASVGPDSAGDDLFRPIVGRGSAYADIDGDGDLDVVMTANGGPARLLRNDGGNQNRWIRFRLTGKTSNREAIGAKVFVRAGKLEQRSQLFPAMGYLSSVELPLTFGLGKEEKVDEVVIKWPSGKTTSLKDLKANRLYRIDEESGLAKE